MKLENAFDVPASPARTWAFLNDVPAVVPCMPGAELTDVVADDSWKARMKVKFGAVALDFVTDVKQVERDDAAQVTGLTARAKEAKGRGGANAKITSTLTAAGDGTRVEIVTDLQMQGAVAQYGRGIVNEVANQMVAQFAANIAAALAQGDDGTPGDASSPGEAADAVGAAGERPRPAQMAPATPIGGFRLLLRAFVAWIHNALRPSRTSG